jgi:hypothetical protein
MRIFGSEAHFFFDASKCQVRGAGETGNSNRCAGFPVGHYPSDALGAQRDSLT